MDLKPLLYKSMINISNLHLKIFNHFDNEFFPLNYSYKNSGNYFYMCMHIHEYPLDNKSYFATQLSGRASDECVRGHI